MKRTVTPIAATADVDGGDLGLAAKRPNRLLMRCAPAPTGGPLTTVIGLL